MNNVSQDDFQTYWAAKVAKQFMLPPAEVASIYTTTDKYNSNHKVREMWKYGCSKGVTGTPAAFVNGVKLDNVPTDVTAWTGLLNDILASQYTPITKQILAPSTPTQ